MHSVTLSLTDHIPVSKIKTRAPQKQLPVYYNSNLHAAVSTLGAHNILIHYRRVRSVASSFRLLKKLLWRNLLEGELSSTKK